MQKGPTLQLKRTKPPEQRKLGERSTTITSNLLSTSSIVRSPSVPLSLSNLTSSIPLSSSTSPTEKRKVQDELLSDEKRQKIVTMMKDSSRGITVKERRFMFKVFPHCFVGSEAVHWLIINGFAKSREEALNIGNMLMFLGDIAHVTKEKHFEDKYEFYKFV